jgi:c-di-GMP-binding flagellar brake protein YcgR
VRERRKFIRFDIPLNVELMLLGDTSGYTMGVTRNFSREGLALVSQNFDLKPKETIHLRLNLPEKDTFVPVWGDIMWKKQLETKCWAGIKFREMDKETKSEILDYAYSLWVEKMRS